MSNRGCKNCYWSEQCRAVGRCGYYDPIDEDGTDDLYIEKVRTKFMKEFGSYQKDQNGYYFFDI